MSFTLTTDAVLARTKTVTRRLGWTNLRIGERLQAVDKLRTKNAQKLAVIEVVTVARERLNAIYDEELFVCGSSTEREGFPNLSPGKFVEMFCKSMRCSPLTTVTRIEFRYVRPEAA